MGLAFKVNLLFVDAVKVTASELIAEATHSKVRGSEYVGRSRLGGIEAVDESS